MADRAIANLLGLAVLGVLAQRPMHRYEIATTIREQGKDDDQPVKWGSLYTVVSALERHGFVEAVGTDRQGGRPERTTYRITAAGRREMADWTRELLADPEPEHPRFAAGLAMLGALPPDEAIALLGARVDRLDAVIADRSANLTEYRERVARLFLVEVEYGLALLRAEANWLRGLLADLGSGGFSGLEDWRAYYGAPPTAEEAADPDV